VALEYTDLVLEYPKGSQAGAAADYNRLRRSISEVDSGQTKIEDFRITLLGEQGSTPEIKATLEYRVKGSNAIFVKEQRHKVTLSSAPLTVSFEAQKEIVSGQDIEVKVKIVPSATRVLKNMRLKVSYPPGFQWKSADPATALGNNTWDLGDISPGMTKTISIRGSILGQEGEDRTFNAFVGESDASDPSKLAVVFSSLSHTISISRPFISARLLVNNVDQEKYSVYSGKSVRGKIAWSNNLPTRIDDVQIRAEITGNALDLKSIAPSEGFYNSLENTIIWDQNTNKEFASVEPGDSGAVEFDFSPLSLMQGANTFIADPQIQIKVSIKAKQPAEGNVFREITNFTEKIVKINSELGLSGKTLYSIGAFANSGPVPPKVGEETTYTIVWTVTNSANNITGAEVRAKLAPFGVRFTGKTSPSTANITYNEATKEVVWKIGLVPKGTGFGKDPLEASFQVALLPSSSQIGSVPLLVGDSFLTGLDVFTEATLESKRSGLSTRISSDPIFTDQASRVVE
jgi:hypothetical protein